MNQTKNIKGNCLQCGGPFDFPVDGIGQTVDCPHCGRPTELQIAAPPATSAVSARQIVYVVVAVVILIGGLVGTMIALKRAQGMKASRIGTVENAREKTLAADPLTQAGFQVSAIIVERATSGSLLYARGTVKNISSSKKFGVKIELELRDEQNWKLGTSTDYQQSLEPGAEWKFKAMVMNPKTASATILSIKEDQ